MYRLKIVKSGNVRTETDPENMVFTSEKGALGYRQGATKSTTTDGDGKIDAYYQHGFDYVPIIVVSVTTKGGKKIAVPGQWESMWDKDFVLEENFYYYIDDDKVYVKAYIHRYEPWMGGDDFPVVGQNYNFEINIYFNEISEES